MKMQKRLNVVLVILIVVLLSLVSFGGVYYKNKNEMLNSLPKYILGAELEGYRQVTLAVKDDNSSEAEETNEEGSEENSESDEKAESDETSGTKTKYYPEDYKKAAEIYRARFNSLKVDNYTLTCDEDTGKIVITLPENDQTDIILSDITQVGKFAIKDSNTDEVLLDNSDVSSVAIGTQQSASGSVTFMSIRFNNKGTSKFKDVTREYQNVVNEDETNTIENSVDENVVSEESESTEDENEGEENNKEESNKKQVSIMIDSTKMLTTDFTEIIDNGVLSLTLGGGTSSDVESKDELYSAYNLGAIIENDSLPVEYEVEGNSYISALIETNKLKSIICIEIGIALAVALVLIFKYRTRGILAAIISVGYIAILLAVIRFANVTLSIEGILAIEVCYIMSSAYSVIFCEYKKEKNLTDKEKAKKFKEIMKKYTIIVIPQLIIAIVCCFTQWSQLTSFGMVVFWGALISWLYNVIVSKLID